MKNKVIANENDKMGLVFYSSSQTKNNLSFKGIGLHMGLETPDAEQIKEVDKIH